MSIPPIERWPTRGTGDRRVLDGRLWFASAGLQVPEPVWYRVRPGPQHQRDEGWPDCIIEPFGHDQAFYDGVGPWTIVKQHAAEIRGRTTVRLLVGDKDRLLPMVTEYHELLASLGIQHQFAVIGPDVFHRDIDIIGKAPFDALAFWRDVFGKVK
jgi:hypothetical protein